MVTMKRLLVGSVGLLLVAIVSGPAGAGPLEEPGFTKVLTCTACHGFGGNSQSDTMPIIAGMPHAYFKKQIETYATGKRPSPEMEPYAKLVLQFGVDEIGQYFANQRMAPTPIKAAADAIARGRVAAAPCVICHGADGKGDVAKLIPGLAGQPPGYLREQMILLKQDQRNPGDAALIAAKALMKSIQDATFADLAAYYSSLR